MPGGMGSKLRHAHPSAIDELAADFPNLTIIAAHPGWPWVDEMTAVALHKGNVFWELSGWAPKYFPAQLKVDIRGRLRDKIMFGSDYPSISPMLACCGEWGELGYAAERHGASVPWQCGTGAGTLKLEEPGRIAAQNHLALCAGQVDLLEKLHRPVIAHREAVVTAEHDALRPHLFDHELHNRLRVGDCVIGEALKVSAGRLRQVL